MPDICREHIKSYMKERIRIKSTGSYDYTKQKIDEYNNIARSSLEKIDGDKEVIKMLDFLLEYLIKREN